MTEVRAARIVSRLAKNGHGGRSDAYRWLLARYEPLRAALENYKPSWPTVAAELEAAGVRGAKGQAIAGNDLRRIWMRVCRDVEIAAARKRTGASLNQRKRQPRDLPANWQPAVEAASKLGHSPPAVQSRRAGDEDSFSRVWREMEGRSGRR